MNDAGDASASDSGGSDADAAADADGAGDDGGASFTGTWPLRDSRIAITPIIASNGPQAQSTIDAMVAELGRGGPTAVLVWRRS